MPTASKQLFQALLTNSNATLYTAPGAPANSRARITSLIVANTDSSDRTVTLDVVPSGGSAGVSHRILPGTTIQANGFMVIDRLNLHVEPGGTVQGLASTTSVVCVTCDGEELT